MNNDAAVSGPRVVAWARARAPVAQTPGPAPETSRPAPQRRRPDRGLRSPARVTPLAGAGRPPAHSVWAPGCSASFRRWFNFNRFGESLVITHRSFHFYFPGQLFDEAPASWARNLLACAADHPAPHPRPSRAQRPPPITSAPPRSDLWLSSKLKDPRDDIRPLRATKGDRPDAGSLNLNPSGHVATTLTGSRGQAWASAAPEPSRRSLRAEEAAVLARPASRKRQTYAPAVPRPPPKAAVRSLWLLLTVPRSPLCRWFGAI